MSQSQRACDENATDYHHPIDDRKSWNYPGLESRLVAIIAERAYCYVITADIEAHAVGILKTVNHLRDSSKNAGRSAGNSCRTKISMELAPSIKTCTGKGDDNYEGFERSKDRLAAFVIGQQANEKISKKVTDHHCVASFLGPIKDDAADKRKC